MTQDLTDAIQTAAQDAMSDFLRDLNDHISARVRYDRDGARYAGENEPEQLDIACSLHTAIVSAVRAALAGA